MSEGMYSSTFTQVNAFIMDNSHSTQTCFIQCLNLALSPSAIITLDPQLCILTIVCTGVLNTLDGFLSKVGSGVECLLESNPIVSLEYSFQTCGKHGSCCVQKFSPNVKYVGNTLICLYFVSLIWQQ